MDTEKNAMDYKYSLVPPEYTETEVNVGVDLKQCSRSTHDVMRRDLRCITCITVSVFITITIMAGTFLVTKTANDIRYKLPFKGSDNVESMQHVASYITENIVEYSVVRPSELFTIIDNFNLDLQIMKIESEEDTVCYVTHLNRSSAVEPSLVSPEMHNLEGKRVYNQNSFITAELPVEDTTFLGKRGEDLCHDAPVYWIHPMSDNEYDDFDMPTKYNSSVSVDETGVLSREKRNVKKCVPSCCQLVCCCNQKYLQWTMKTSVNCHNLCRGCTFLSRKQLRKTYLCVN